MYCTGFLISKWKWWSEFRDDIKVWEKISKIGRVRGWGWDVKFKIPEKNQFIFFFISLFFVNKPGEERCPFTELQTFSAVQYMSFHTATGDVASHQQPSFLTYIKVDPEVEYFRFWIQITSEYISWVHVFFGAIIILMRHGQSSAIFSIKICTLKIWFGVCSEKKGTKTVPLGHEFGKTVFLLILLLHFLTLQSFSGL